MFVKVYSRAEKDLLKSEYVNLASGDARIQNFSNQELGEAINLMDVYDPTPTGPNVIWRTGLDQADGRVEIHFGAEAFIAGFSLNMVGIPSGDVPISFQLDARREGEHDWEALVRDATVKENTETFFKNQELDICMEVDMDMDRVVARNARIRNRPLVRYSQVRLVIASGGGAGRLRVYGRFPTPNILEGNPNPANLLTDVLGIRNGARVIENSETLQGVPGNIILNGVGERVRHGWLAIRSRLSTDESYFVVKMARPAVVACLDINIDSFVGLAPTAFQIFGRTIAGDWHSLGSGRVVLNRQRYELDARGHIYDHILLAMYPRSGLMRARVQGWFTNTRVDMTHAEVQTLRANRVARQADLIHFHATPMDINGNLGNPNNTRLGTVLYAYILVARELRALNTPYNTTALLRLINQLSRDNIDPTVLRRCLVRLRRFLATPEGIQFLNSMPPELVTDNNTAKTIRIDADDAAEHSPTQVFFRRFFVEVAHFIADPGVIMLTILHFIRTLNPNNTNPATLPDPILSFARGAPIRTRIPEFNIAVEYLQKSYPAQTQQVQGLIDAATQDNAVEDWPPRLSEYIFELILQLQQSFQARQAQQNH